MMLRAWVPRIAVLSSLLIVTPTLPAATAPSRPNAARTPVVPTRPAQALEPATDAAWWQATLTYLGRHVRIGTRWIRTDLTDDKRTPTDSNGNGKFDDSEVLSVSYMGSIVGLQEVNDDWPDKVFVQWAFNDYVGIETSYEHFQARTITFWDGHTDGAFDLRGPLLSLYGTLPNRTRFTPRLGVGMVFLDTEFIYDPGWHSNPIAGQSLTTDETTSWAGTRLGYDITGWACYLGCDIRLVEHWALEFYARQMYVHDLEAHYTLWPANYPQNIDDRGFYHFPMDNRAIGIGLRCSF
jgi:hypothetical protein